MSEYMLRVHKKANVVMWNNKAWFPSGVNLIQAGGLNQDLFQNPNLNDSVSLTRKN